MGNDWLDETLLFQVAEALSGQRAVDFHSVDENSDGNQTVGLDVLVELLRGGLVEENGVLGLVLDLGPLPLVLPSSSSRRRLDEGGNPRVSRRSSE